jgi:ATP-dependent Zn protease
MPFPRLIPHTQKKGLTLSLIGFLLALLALVAFQNIYQRSQPVVRNVQYPEIRALAETSRVLAVSVDGELLSVRQKDGTLAQSVITNPATQNDVIALFAKNNVAIVFESQRPGALMTALNWGLPILMLLTLGVVGWRIYASIGGHGDFQLADASGAQTVTFRDVGNN